MRAGVRALFLVLLAWPPRPASAQARPPVSVDWAGVSDETIARCGLRGLENLVVQYLVEEGYAVVDRVGPTGLSARIDAREDRFEVAVSRAGRVERAAVPIPEPCDASIQLDLVRAILARAAPLGAEWRQARREARSPRAQPEPRSALRATAGVGIAFPGHLHPLALLRAGGALDTRIGRLALAVELGGTVAGGLVLLEPALAASGTTRVLDLGSVAVIAGVEVAALAHVVTGGPTLTGHADGRAALQVGVTGADGSLAFVLAPYARLVRVVHEVDGQEAYRSAHLGVSARAEVTF